MKQRTLTYVLVGSLALNVFLLGVTSVHVFSRRHHAEDCRREANASPETLESTRGPRFLRQMVRAAGGPRDPRVRELWSGHRQHLAPVREQVVSANERVLQALEREPFDRQALAQALTDALNARHRADELANEGALQLAEKLTPEERANFGRAARSPRRNADGKPNKKNAPRRTEGED